MHELSDVCLSHFSLGLGQDADFRPGLLQASDQFLEFLKNFYKTFPEYKHMDVRSSRMHLNLHDSHFRVTLALSQTYIAGESFAGQYIPYFCAYTSSH